jgi:cellobionic acid phosphorylase
MYSKPSSYPDILGSENSGAIYRLYSPTLMPSAAGFLWNKRMLIQANCRGYAIAQFMQPEQPYYANHPGRFFYIKDNVTKQFFSALYEPVRAQLAHFEFINEGYQIRWIAECLGVIITLYLRLPTETAVECWQLKVENLQENERDISVYFYFPVGHRSWMNQSLHELT